MGVDESQNIRMICISNGFWNLQHMQDLHNLNQHINLGGGFKYFSFSPLPGEDSQFDMHIFQMGWNHQLENLRFF